MKYLFCLVLLGCKVQKMQEVFALPNEFKGRVIVFYGAENGVEAEVSKGRIIYNIPESGVLFIKKKKTEGISQVAKFFIKRGDNLSEIKYVQNRVEIVDDKIYAFSYSAAEFTKEYGSKPINYSIFLVGTQFEYDELLKSKFNIDWDSLLFNKNMK